MNKRTIVGLVVPLLFAVSSAGANITYVGAFDLSNGLGDDPDASVSLSITTDGVLGALVKSDIIDYTISITQGGATATLDPSDTFLEFYTEGSAGFDDDGGHLTATASDLDFLFDGSLSGVLFQGDPRGPFFCLQNQSCSNGQGAQIQASTNIDAPFGGSPYLTENGEVTIGTASGSTLAVPEPTTWAMMISGFGLTGGMLRRKSRSKEVAA